MLQISQRVATLVVAGLLACLLPLPAAAADSGRLEGRVTSADQTGVGGVDVVLEPGSRRTVSDDAGDFSFAGLPPGTYSLAFRLGELDASVSDLAVTAGEVTRVEQAFTGEIRFADTLTVESASRRRERLVDAPAAVTRLDAEEISLAGGDGSIPHLLETSVGTEITQSGLYDVNLNTRGMNGFLTRRIQVQVDGRDAAAPDTSGQDWWTIAFLTQDLESLELIRGPSSALYGANSVNGVLSLVTKPARDSQGGRLRLTLGELDTTTADFRWAGSLGHDRYFKVLGNHTESDSFTVARNQGVEYPGLPGDAIAPRGGGIDFDSGGLRFEGLRPSGHVFTLEAGRSDGGGEVYVAGIGRAQQLDVERSWARFAYDATRWNLAAHWNDRTGDQLALQAGVPLYSDSRNTKVEIQGHTDAVGSEAYNMTLSERRATAVRNYLLGNFDLSALQLTAKGYGESDPIASNETDEGRARNRRVQFVIEE